MRCKRCNERYIGETARNGFTRGREHIRGIIKKRNDSVFHLHNIENHNGSGRVSDFEMKVAKVYSGDATKRQVPERRFRFNTPGCG